MGERLGQFELDVIGDRPECVCIRKGAGVNSERLVCVCIERGVWRG